MQKLALRYGLENDVTDTEGYGNGDIEKESETNIIVNVNTVDEKVDQVDEQIEEVQEMSTELETDNMAMESLFSNMHRNMRTAFALEDLAENLETTVEGDGEGIDSTTAKIIIDASEPLANDIVIQSAVESMYLNSRIATESLIDSIKEKAKSIFNTVKNAISNVTEALSERLSRFIIKFRDASAVIKKLAEDKEILASVAGKPLDEKFNAKLNKFVNFSGDGNDSLMKSINDAKTLTSRVLSFKEMLVTNIEELTSSSLNTELTPKEVELLVKTNINFINKAISYNGMIKLKVENVPTNLSHEELTNTKEDFSKVDLAIDNPFEHDTNGTASYKVLSASQVDKFATVIEEIAKDSITYGKVLSSIKDRLMGRIGNAIKNFRGKTIRLLNSLILLLLRFNNYFVAAVWGFKTDVVELALQLTKYSYRTAKTQIIEEVQ